MRVSRRALPGHPLASGGSGGEPRASACPRDGGRRMMHVARERCSVRAEVGWGRCREGSPSLAPQFSHSPKEHRRAGKPSAARTGEGVCAVLAGWGLPHCLCSLQTHPSPLIFLCGSSRACQKNALDGARERAGRAVRVCARSCAPVLPLTSLKRAVPELQRRGSLQFFVARLLREAAVALRARSCPGSEGPGIPRPAAGARPGARPPPPPAAPESRQMGGRAPAGC